MRCTSSTAHCPQTVWLCKAGAPLPTAPRRCGSAVQEFHCPLPRRSEARCTSSTAHCPLPPDSVVVQSRSSTAHCPQAVRQCIAGVPLPTAPVRQCVAGNEAVRCRSSTAHCPQAVRQCAARVPQPTAPRRCGGAKQELHCPLPTSSEAVQYKSCAAHCPQAVWQCIAEVPLLTAHCPLPTSAVRRGTHSAVRSKAPSSAAPHTKY